MRLPVIYYFHRGREVADNLIEIHDAQATGQVGPVLPFSSGGSGRFGMLTAAVTATATVNARHRQAEASRHS